MAEDCCYLHKDTFVIKPPKKSLLVWKMVVLTIVIICGVYICSVCLKQLGMHGPRLMKIELIEEACSDSKILQPKLRYAHFPKPTTYNREECACTPVRLFAILSMQRSGSGWLETLLNSHVNISSNGEIFSVKERRSNISTITSTLDKVYNLDWYTSAAKNECTTAIGLKWMLNQGVMAHHEEIADYFKRRGVSVIFLFRRNLLRRLVSVLANVHDRSHKQLNGTHKAHVHSKLEADILARYKPTINTTSLVSDLKHMSEPAARILEYFKTISHMLLYYEDLVTNRTKLMDVQEFLQVPQRKLVSRHVKIHTGPLSQQIENWDAVYSTLKGSQYESFLNSD